MDSPGPPLSTSDLVLGDSASRDARRGLVLAAIGVVPGVGAPARAILEQLWGPAFNRRVELWIGLLIDKIVDLELEVEDLRERLGDGVASVVSPLAVEAATRSADPDKLERLAVAVANVVRDNERWTGYEDHAQTMMRLLDETTSTQFALLAYLDDPAAWLHDRGLTLSVALNDDGRLPLMGVVGLAFPALAGEPVIVGAAIGALEARGLLNLVVGGDVREASFSSPHDLSDGVTSVTGRELVRFVRGGYSPTQSGEEASK